MLHSKRFETVRQPAGKLLRHLGAIGTCAALTMGTGLASGDSPHPRGIEPGKYALKLPRHKPNSNPNSSIRLPRHIVNISATASGYPTGNMVEGDTFVYSGYKEKAAKGVYLFGLIFHQGHPEDTECGWIRKLHARQRGVHIERKQDICMDKKEELENRYTIGQQFNCGEHECSGGDPNTQLKSGCDLDPKLNYNQREGRSYDVLRVTPDDFHYRYTTPDGQRAWGMAIFKQTNDPAFIWLTVPRSCIVGRPDDGPPLDPSHG